MAITYEKVACINVTRHLIHIQYNDMSDCIYDYENRKIIIGRHPEYVKRLSLLFDESRLFEFIVHDVKYEFYHKGRVWR